MPTGGVHVEYALLGLSFSPTRIIIMDSLATVAHTGEQRGKLLERRCLALRG